MINLPKYLSARGSHPTSPSMTDDEFYDLPAVKAARERLAAIGPKDDWSNMGELPTDVARSIQEARNQELFGGLRGRSAVGGEWSQSRSYSAVNRMASIDPQDAMESMLAELMVLTHSAATACVANAHDVGLGSPAASIHLSWFQRLSTMYVQQMSVLDKRRGKAQQKVIVERVDVGPGGRAIVGVVQPGCGSNSPPQGACDYRANIISSESAHGE